MRVISGSAGGRKLEAPDGIDVRPTSDRVREAVFNALFSRFDIEGLAVVDLFAGTGAYGIEALSRGAAHATFVDRDRRSVGLVTRNVESLGFGDRSTIITGDALSWAANSSGRTETVDVAFCDPPYAFADWDRLLAPLNAEIAVIESSDEISLPDGWEPLRTRKYGSTIVTLSQRSDLPAGGQ